MENLNFINANCLFVFTLRLQNEMRMKRKKEFLSQLYAEDVTRLRICKSQKTNSKLPHSVH